MPADAEFVDLLHQLGFKTAPRPEPPAGLSSEHPVVRVVPAASGFEVRDGEQVIGQATDEAGAVEAARDAVARAGGGQVHVYGDLHLIRRAFDVEPAPPAAAPAAPAAAAVEADQRERWQTLLRTLADHAPAAETRQQAAAVLAAAPQQHSSHSLASVVEAVEPWHHAIIEALRNPQFLAMVRRALPF